MCVTPRLRCKITKFTHCSGHQVRRCEIVALDQQERAHRLGERVGRAAGEVQRRLRIDAFAKANDLRDIEAAKIACGEAHFKALATGSNPARYVKATKTDDLMDYC